MSFLTASLAALSLASVAPQLASADGLTCEAVFAQADSGNASAPGTGPEFSAGFRLSTQHVALVLSDPTLAELRSRLSVLSEAASFLRTATDAALVELSTTGRTPDSLSLASQVVLVRAVEELNRGRSEPAPRTINAWTRNTEPLRKFLRAAAAARKLPNLSDALETDPLFFIEFASVAYGHTFDVKLQPNEHGAAQADDITHGFVRPLFNRLQVQHRVMPKPEPIDRVLVLAMNLLPPESAPTFLSHAHLMLGRDKNARINNAKIVESWPFHDRNSQREFAWQYGGVQSIRSLMIRLTGNFTIHDRATRVTAAPSKADAAARMIQLGYSPQSPYFNFYVDAIMAMFSSDQPLIRDPKLIRAQINQTLTEFGGTIRAEADIRLKQKRAEDAAIEAQLVSMRAAAAPTLRSKGVRVAQVPGRLIRRSEIAREADGAGDATQRKTGPVEGSVSIATIREQLDVAVEPGKVYWFQFAGDKQSDEKIGYLKFEGELLEQVRGKHQDIRRWISAFLKGPVAAQGASGIKAIGHTAGVIWEIKILGSPDVLLVKRDKSNQTWTLLSLVPKERVSSYVDSRGWRK